MSRNSVRLSPVCFKIDFSGLYIGYMGHDVRKNYVSTYGFSLTKALFWRLGNCACSYTVQMLGYMHSHVVLCGLLYFANRRVNRFFIIDNISIY